MTTPVETPELDRQHDIIESGKAPVVQEFIDWLQANGYVIEKVCPRVYPKVVPDDPASVEHFLNAHQSARTCEVCGNTNYTGPIWDFEKLMAEHFDIDLNKIEQERRALLDQIRSQA